MRLDWKEYYNRFSELHGGQPIVYKADRETGQGGFLLFSDGWMYSRSDPSGPEYPPDNDEDAQNKVLFYWRYRYVVTGRAYNEAKGQLQSLIQMQQGRSAPLQIVEQMIVENEDGNRVGSKDKTVEVDFGIELDKLRGLWSDMQRSKQKLNALDFQPVSKLNFSPAGVLTEIEEIERDE